jgi:mRNA interferase MazF
MKSGSPNIYIPERGDIVKINFSPHQGHEQGFERPAIILSPSQYNRMTSLSLMCPITTKSKGFKFEVQLSDGMQTAGVILSDHIKSFDWKARQVKFIEKAPIELVEEVLAKLETLLA